MTIKKAFDNFICSRKLADLSGNTIKDYQNMIGLFVKYVGEDNGVEIITHELINDYIMDLMQRPISKTTRATYIRNMKIFLNWIESAYTTNYTASEIRVPKSPKKQVKIYSNDEVIEIFKNVETSCDWVTLRNKCIIACMYDSGLRQSEVCTLKRVNVSFSENRMTVLGKGNKERTVPLGKFTKHYMKAYIDMCPYRTKSVFVTFKGEELTCNAVKIFVRRLADKLSFPLSSHKLRHNFATNYCIDQYDQRGYIDIYRLAYLMGHEDIKTTKRYLHFAYEIIASRECISHLDNIFSMSN